VNIRQASFAIRVVRRRDGNAGIVYRRSLDKNYQERLTRLGSVSPLAFSAGTGLLRTAVQTMSGSHTKLASGPFHPMDADWGARVACYSLIAMGLRNADRLHRAAENLRHADGPESAWWLGLMTGPQGTRARRALRIFVEAVK